VRAGRRDRHNAGMESASGPRMIPGFEHVPGNHCGSTAIRNLLAHGGIEISEELAFGLGAGARFFYVVFDDASPSRWFNGRTAQLEQDFLDLTGAPLLLETFPEPGAAWEAARASVDAGRPALLLTDLYYLDHYGKSAHFPGHAVVLAGYDDESVYLSDTGFEDLQTSSIEGLRKARHADHPAFKLEGQMFTLEDGATPDDLAAAAPPAIAQAAKEMIEPSFGKFAGLPALRRLDAEAASWPEVAEDWQWCARFGYQVIEKRGTGGGNFRAMYSRFLAEVGETEGAELAATAAASWTELAAGFKQASERDEPDPAIWSRIGELTGSVLASEEELWSTLARRD
jgi:hypothetical protein